MHTYQVVVIASLTVMLFVKNVRAEVLILLFANLFYFRFITSLDASYYYSAVATLNLVAGYLLHKHNKTIAIFSYLLVPNAIIGLFLWYKYQPPDLYDNISLIIICLQLAFIVKKGTPDGVCASIREYTLAK